MKIAETLNYEAPQVEIIEVEVEQGFATSVEPLENGGDFWRPGME